MPPYRSKEERLPARRSQKAALTEHQGPRGSASLGKTREMRLEAPWDSFGPRDGPRVGTPGFPGVHSEGRAQPAPPPPLPSQKAGTGHLNLILKRDLLCVF